MSAIPTSSPSTQLSDRSWKPKQAVARRPSPTWALFQKECRQIAPLFLALLLIATLVHVVGAINGAIQSNGSNFHVVVHQVVFILMPALFAIGAGAVLVSQEKELKTLLWLSSLPIPIKELVRLKLLAGVLGLALFWLLSSCIAFVFYPHLANPSGVDTLIRGPYGAMQCVLSSYFLLIASMVCCWVFESTWVALVMLIPVGIASFLVNYGLDSMAPALFQNHGEGHAGRLLLATLGTLFSTAVISAIGLYWGRRSFVASPSSFALSGVSIPSYSPFPGGSSKNWKTDSLFTSLIWQAGFQNPMLWVAGLGSILLVPFAFSGNHDVIFSLGLIAAVLVSWLGASTFGTDGIKGRIRFLADRGISPGLVWTTRMFLPAVVISVSAIGVAVGLLNAEFSRATWLGEPSQLLGAMCLFGLLIFAVTQWSSMWMRSTLMAMCLAPALTVAIAAYTSFVMAFGANRFLLLGTALTMLLASRIMTRPWMDGRTGWKVIFQHLGWGIVALAIPVIPTLWVLSTYPTMSREASRQLAAIADLAPGPNSKASNAVIRLQTVEQLTQKTPNTVGGMGLGEGENAEENSPPNSVDWSKKSSELLAGLEHQLETFSEGSADGAVRYFVKGEAVLTSLALEKIDQDTDSDDESHQARVRDLEDRYRRSIQLLHKLVQRDRQSGSLRDNEFADRYESWLVREFGKAAAKRILGDTNYREISHSLADTKGRDDARRYAIAIAWKTLQNPERGYDPRFVESFEVPQKGPMALLPNYLISKRRAGVALEALLDLLNARDRNPGSPTVQRYEKIWVRDGLVTVDSISLATAGIPTATAPGLLWFKDWEADGRRLVNTTVE